jgi:hypothetical protein
MSGQGATSIVTEATDDDRIRGLAKNVERISRGETEGRREGDRRNGKTPARSREHHPL